jgi:tetratricopeptide (TPR) repeat protein
MSSLVKIAFLLVLCRIAPLAVPRAQAQRTGEPEGSALRVAYNDAVRFQQAGKLDLAADRYRDFLAAGLGQLAVGYARLGDYRKAASLFDESIALKPGSPAIRLEYATIAIAFADAERAETLARALLRDDAASGTTAKAHQILGRALLRMNKNREAREEFEKAVALEPSFENGYDLAVACLDLDDEKCAKRVFGEMEASFGNTPEIHMHFGNAYGNSDFQHDAAEEFEKAIAANPNYPGAHYSLAAAWIGAADDAAKTKAAEGELKKEIAISPKDYLSYAALGKIAAAQHKYADAEKYLTTAASLDPTNPDAYLYLGQMYRETDRPDDAIAALRRCIELTANPARNRFQVEKAHYLLGRILMQRHREEESRSEMQIARALQDKRLVQDRGKLAGLLDSPQLKPDGNPSTDGESSFVAPGAAPEPGAVRELSAFEEQLKPAIADSYNNLGAIAATDNRLPDALQYFERAAEWNPALDGLDYNLGRAAFSNAKYAEALQPLGRYLGAHPEDTGIRTALAMSQFMTDGYSDCLETLRKASDSVVSIPQMRYVFAMSLIRTGEVSSGRERLEALEKAYPEIAEVHRGLGEALNLQGERRKAIEELTEAIRLQPGDAETHYDLGAAELKSGEAIAAIAELQTAIRLRPSAAAFHRSLSEAYKLAKRPVDAERESRIVATLSEGMEPSAETGSGASATKAP